MSYLEFLLEPYNRLFLATGAGGLIVYLVGHARPEDFFVPVTALWALTLWGLTLTGAVHDLGLGDPAERFPAVLVASVVLALVTAASLHRLRQRYFPPVQTVRFNEPDLEGVEARVVSRRVDGKPGSGRAHWHDGRGVLHLVRCHTSGDSLRFGTKVQLEEFDEDRESYRVSPA